MEDLNRAISLDPKFAPSYLNRGNVRRAMGDVAGALNDYDRSIALDPNSGIAFFDRAVLHADGREYALARADFQRALHLYAGAGDDDYRVRAQTYLRDLTKE